jgi:pyruvate,water dikinase
MRGVSKSGFVMAIDVARAAARRLGELLSESRVIANRDDIFYLTFDEITGQMPADAKTVVARRRARREEYLRVDMPVAWTGTPVPSLPHGEATDVVTGLGVSSGVVEGVVRVVTSENFAEVRPNEILVASTTDPSWASIMFISAGLVVDIGGALSHAAVVARELGYPCVVNTRTGTKSLHTGDRVRVDGSSGVVVVLERSTERNMKGAE